MGYKPPHFNLPELVDKPLYDAHGERLWELLSPKLLQTLEALRTEFGAIVINNWQAGGPFHESGLRAFQTTTGAKFSCHKYGLAADCKPQNLTPQEMHARILARPDRFPFLTCLEAIASTPSWVHVDVRNHSRNEQVWVVQP